MTAKSPENTAIRAARFMARADVFSYALLWLMVLLVAGTLSEKTIGLYMAQKIYFSSFIFWLGGVLPLPGVMLTVTFIFAGMLCKLGLDKWHWKDLGTIVIHIGAGLLLAGGFLTAQFSAEGSMVIPQGESRDYIESDDRVELAVTPLDGGAETTFGSDQFKPGAILTGGLPFAVEVVSWCRNCGLQRLKKPVTEGDPHGVAINFVLHDLPRNPIEENNRAGLTFRLKNTGDRDGLYAVFEDMPIPQTITVADKEYLIAMRHTRTALPFSIRLVQFEQAFYPGTGKPRSYKSEVVLDDDGAQWRSLIQMNEPLRYKGYTFYQASYMEGAPQATTVLAVVKNIGRTFPYISSIVICIGMLIHLFQRLPAVLREKQAPA